MPIFLNPANFIIPKEVLIKKYAGGIVQFKKDFLFDPSFHDKEDDELLCIGNVNADCLDVNLLVEKGLAFDEEKQQTEDFVILQVYDNGFLWETKWCKTNKVYAWHKDTAADQFALMQQLSATPMHFIELFFDFSDFNKLHINKDSYARLKFEIESLWVLIEQKLQKDFEEDKQHRKDFNKMIASADKEIVESTPHCFLPEMKELEKDVYLFIDERDGFVADGTYVKQKTACEKALRVLKKEGNYYNINKNNLQDFFEESLELYLQLFDEWNYKAYAEFRHVFFGAIGWMEYYKLGDTVVTALQKLNPYNEDDIEGWLYEYDYLYFCNSIFRNSFLSLIDLDNHLYQHPHLPFAYLQGKEITDCITFGEQYNFYRKEKRKQFLHH